MAGEILSVVEDQGLNANSCGYCKSNTPTSFAYGLWAHSLSPYDYQELLDKSWRRSGMFLYRPELENSCCASYTIRLKVDLFKMSKEHIRAMHRMQRYIDGMYTGPASPTKDSVEKNEKNQYGMSKMDMGCNERNANLVQEKFVEMDDIAKLLTIEIHQAIKDCISSGEYPADIDFPTIKVARTNQLSSKRGNEVCYMSNVALSCAARILKHENSSRILQYAALSEKKSDAHQKIAVMLAKSIAAKLQNYESISHIKIEAPNGYINFTVIGVTGADSSTLKRLCHANNVHEKANCKLNTSTATSSSYLSRQLNGNMITKHKFEIRTKRSSFDAEEFALYRRYQMAIHHENEEDVTEDAFRRFLVDTPLTFLKPLEYGNSFCGFGSFHQQYLIDDRLVAVGVIDILPSCLSSNYFFWDPDLAFLSLGKYAALREIQLVQDLKVNCPSLEYYYLGHYIHSCPKMHYKVGYRPSELLCSVRMQWVPFDLARPLLDKQHCACLSDGLPEDAFGEQEKSQSMEHDYSKNMGDKNLGQGSQRANRILLDSNSTRNDDIIRAVLLKIDDQYLRFSNLQDWAIMPQEYMDVLMTNLQRYTKIVGAGLAAKMAYIFG